MIEINFDHRCKHCNSLIIYDPANREEDGDTVLDLNHKRHFCSNTDKIVHECQTVEHVKKLIDGINKTELSSFELELRIVDEVNKF